MEHRKFNSNKLIVLGIPVLLILSFLVTPYYGSNRITEDDIDYSPKNPVVGESVDFEVPWWNEYSWTIGKLNKIEELGVREKIQVENFEIEFRDASYNRRRIFMLITNLETDETEQIVSEVNGEFETHTLWGGSLMIRGDNVFLGSEYKLSGIEVIAGHKTYKGDEITHRFKEEGEYMVEVEVNDGEEFYTVTKEIEVDEEGDALSLRYFRRNDEDTSHIVLGEYELNQHTPTLTWYLNKFLPVNTPQMMNSDMFNETILQDEDEELSSNDMLVLLGNQESNKIYKRYLEMGATSLTEDEDYKLKNGKKVTSLTYEEDWEADEGYFVIQFFEDPETGGLVLSIYGTNPDSTVAGVYHFAYEIYPRTNRYTKIQYVIGKWEDDEESGTDLPIFLLMNDEELEDEEVNGFSRDDEIKEIHRGSRFN